MNGSSLLQNPFPGLRPFGESEEHLFFGRESQVERMIDKLAASRFLAVVGTSGSGKSSLVNCGLRPGLHRGLMAKAGTSWRMAQFRPGGNPVGAMAHALAEPGVLFDGYQPEGLPLDQIVEATLRMSSLGLTDIYEQAHLNAGTNLLIVADQFEELFRYRRAAGFDGRDAYGASPEAVAFVNLLLEAQGQPDYPIYVVLTMRSDFLGDCSQFQGLPEAINEGQYLVPRMTREERRAAIAGPVDVGGAAISPVLLTRLINDVGDNPDQLSILQHALNRTWARWQHEGSGRDALTLEHYESIGAMAQALDRHAEKAYDELASGRQQKICEKVFKALTDKGSDARGIRRPTRLGKLCALSGASAAEITDVLNVFRKPSRSFVMPPSPQALETDTVIDISHESLMRVWNRLKSWADEEAVSARMYRRVAETAALHAAGKAAWWRDPDLQVALDWRRNQEPSAAWAEQYQGGFDVTMSFLDGSKEVQDKAKAEVEFERRWRRSWALLLLVATLLLFLANLERHSRVLELVAFSWVPLLALQDRLSTALRTMLVTTLLATPYFLSYLGLAYYGKRFYRRAAFSKILEEMATPTREPDEVTARPAKGVVSAPLELGTSYAGFGRRLLAYIVDVVVFIVMGFASTMLFFIVRAMLGYDSAAGQTENMFIFSLWFGLDWLYQAASISSGRQATLGKRLAGIFVTDVGGQRLSFSRATARHVARLLSYYSVVGFPMQMFTKNRQALHDLIAKSVVLRGKATRRATG